MKYFITIIFFAFTCAIYAQVNPLEDLCLQGDRLVSDNKAVDCGKIISLFRQCWSGCPECRTQSRIDRYEDCRAYLANLTRIAEKTQSTTNRRSGNQPQMEIPMPPEITYEVRIDTVFQERDILKIRTDTLVKIRTDTLIITDNRNLIRPYRFIPSWTMDRKTWQRTFIGGGALVAVGGGLTFGLLADSNWRSHRNGDASNIPKHDLYHKRYKRNTILMWTCIGVGLAALSSILLHSQVPNNVAISPGIYIAPQQGDLSVGMTMRLNF